MKLYHDQPMNNGVANAIRRARQLTDVKWTPAAPLASGISLDLPDGRIHAGVDFFTPAHRPVKGVNYSSARTFEKFVGYNVSLETFVTAAANPYSVLYEHPQHERGRGIYSYYGTVCSCFVSYALDLHYHIPSIAWGSHPDVTLVDSDDLDALQLCDIVNHPGDHITLITDIARDEDGHVREIEVSESIKPRCVRVTYTPEEFRAFWLERGYRVYRYAKLESVTYTPTAFSPVEGDPDLGEAEINRSLLPDFGNKANYLRGAENIELSVLEPGWDHVEVTNPDGSVCPYALDHRTHVLVIPNDVGHYSACCVKGDRRSAKVEWNAVEVALAPDKTVYRVGEPVRLHFENLGGDRVFLAGIFSSLNYFKVRKPVSDEEIAQKEVCLDTSKLVPGAYYVTVLSENAYGKYIARRCGIRVE